MWPYGLQSRGGASTLDLNTRPWRIAAGEIEGVMIARLHAALVDRRWLIESLRLEGTTHNKVGAILISAGALATRLRRPIRDDRDSPPDPLRPSRSLGAAARGNPCIVGYRFGSLTAQSATSPNHKL